MDDAANIRLRGDALPFVSRGGLKLDHALDLFGMDPPGWVCFDAGSSTGGFTDCLLQRGAAKVYAVDVGTNQLHWKLRSDPRVVSMEQVNLRYWDPARIPERCRLLVADLSFISLRLVIPPLLPSLGPGRRRGAAGEAPVRGGPGRGGFRAASCATRRPTGGSSGRSGRSSRAPPSSPWPCAKAPSWAARATRNSSCTLEWLEEAPMLFMVIESYRDNDMVPTYRRLRDKDRMLPEG